VFVLDSLLPPEQAPAVEVTRWRRFRHERAYVRVNGHHIGYRDLRTGTVHAFRDEDVAILALATADLSPVSGKPLARA
jgi:hypothetical protein